MKDGWNPFKEAFKELEYQLGSTFLHKIDPKPGGISTNDFMNRSPEVKRIIIIYPLQISSWKNLS